METSKKLETSDTNRAALSMLDDGVLALHPRTPAGFRHIYGWLGLPTVMVFLLSAVWTMALALIQLAPTFVANDLMGTEQFDFGEFWLLPKADDNIAVPAVAALVIFAIGYAALAVLMIFPDKLLSPTTLQAASSSRLNSVSAFVPSRATSRPSISVQMTSVAVQPVATRAVIEPKLRRRPSSFSSAANKLRARMVYDADSPFLALPKLVFQTTTLFTYLNEGFPTMLIFTYSSLLLTNWLLSGYRFVRMQLDPYLIVSRVCYSFDLFFAVFAPMHVLIYAYYHFEFDRAVLATRVEAFSASSFDRTARLFADPTQISLFRIGFHHLQLSTSASLLIKSVLNVLTILKWHHVIVHLVQLSVIPRTEIAHVDDCHLRQKRWDRVRRLALVATFFSTGLVIFCYSVVAVVTSARVCQAHIQCRVPSYQWNLGASHCSCIVFVDRELLITTMAAWEDPLDTTENLARLAYTGHLKIVQIINRQLPTLPDELRNCRGLEQLILLYTKTLTIPDWAKEFHKLEYLHLEGDLTAKQLTHMPRDLFVNMNRLLFLHLGCHMKLPYVPDLNYLVRLEYLVLAMLHSITEIPAMDKLVNLKKMSVIDDIALVSLPAISSLSKLNTFALSYRVPVCCNGFLPGGCNLTAFACLDRSSQEGEARVQCSTNKFSSQDYQTLEQTQGEVCPPNLPFDLKDVGPNLIMVDQLCGGVLYKQCALGDLPGICFPARIQPIMCMVDQEYIALRRLQIQRRVGDPCDVEVEKWLGCA